MASKKIRIGLVLFSVPPYSETFFTTKINGLTQQGFEVYLFAAGKRNPGLYCKGIKPYPVFQSSFARLVAASLIVPLTFVRAPGNLIRFWKYERASGNSTMEVFKKVYLNAHIFPHSVDWLHFGFASAAVGREGVAKAIGAKMAVSFRGYDLNVYPLKHPGCYKRLWERVDKVHSISNYLLQKAYSLGLPSDKPCQVIAPALNSNDKNEVKTSLEFQDPIRILTVARLTWIKGLEYGIRATAILKSMKIRVQYTIIGEGPDYEKLLFEIHDLDLAGQVNLVGKLSHEETLQAMTQTDIYIQPSLNEGFCNSVLEAQALGCLCIASNAGGLPENILQNVTGWLVASRSPEQIAQAVDRIVRMPGAERTQIIQNASRRAHQDFAIASHVEKWVNFYK